MSTRRVFLQLGTAVGVGAAIRWQLDPTTGVLFQASRAFASVQVPQTPLPAGSVTQFAAPLPTFAGRRVTTASFSAQMTEFQQKVLPDSVYASLQAPFSAGTYVWGYQVDGAPASYPAVSIEAQKGRTTTVTWVNAMPSTPFLQKYLTIDQTIHWADPLNQMGSFAPFSGPPPMVTHLHGAEDRSNFDGAPEAWFTPDGRHGKGYDTAVPTAANAAVYQYPNGQQSTTLWFHDHTLGITRINVLSGLAGAYLLRDTFDTGLSTNPLKLPSDGQEQELIIQDRQFDTNGQWLFPDGSPAANPNGLNGAPPNPGIHPYWIPEFFGDVIVVNGRAWPFFNVQPRRYRFRLINGSNARFYRMTLANSQTGAAGPAIWQIGTDGGLLDRPVKAAQGEGLKLRLAPGERADVIIDFAGLSGQNFTLTNDAPFPFPDGDGAPVPPNLPGSTPDGSIMQFKVNQTLVGRDTTFDPSATNASLRGGRSQEPVIVRLANPTTGSLGAGVNPDRKRQLILVEVADTSSQDRGPIEVLLNNTKWNGLQDRDGQPPDTPVTGAQQLPDTHFRPQNIWLTELPRVGSTEVWEIANLTEDAHPIHIHLIQFQLMNRQDLNRDGYRAGYDALFPGGKFAGEVNPEDPNTAWGVITYPSGTFIPGYGPPRPYNTANSDGAVGGNPAFSPFLSGAARPPDANEAGWKDTVVMFPGTVTRIVARWAPQDIAIGGVQAGVNRYSFDPSQGPGYVWHCHIFDHEDNEMMRPYVAVP